ncbi:MAG: nicotinate-nicotinamide nucleotide adenylyltransferase [Bacilli bacterium]
MTILYGGAFNPPTIAHQKIIHYLVDHYPEDQLILLPASSSYRNEIISFEHRKNMLKLLVGLLKHPIEISDYEAKQSQFRGTIETLIYFDHPLFVIGSDQLLAINRWISFPRVVEDNRFLVFPRSGIDGDDYLMNHPILCHYRDHFEIVTDFVSIEASSSAYRDDHELNMIPVDVEDYINKHHLYEVK